MTFPYSGAMPDVFFCLSAAATLPGYSLRGDFCLLTDLCCLLTPVAPSYLSV